MRLTIVLPLTLLILVLAPVACGDGEPEPQPTPDYIGVATMLEDGTIVLVLGRAGEAFVEHELRYPPSHPRYQEILEHLGGLQPGESKPVPPWPEETAEPAGV